MFGASFSGWLHVWWGGLETHANRFLPERTVGKYVNTAYKVAWDQLCSAVLFNVGYVASVSLGKGENMEECAERIQEQVPSQMILHWKFWPAFHFFNFLYVPLDVSPFSRPSSCICILLTLVLAVSSRRNECDQGCLVGTAVVPNSRRIERRKACQNHRVRKCAWSADNHKGCNKGCSRMTNRPMERLAHTCRGRARCCGVDDSGRCSRTTGTSQHWSKPHLA